MLKLSIAAGLTLAALTGAAFAADLPGTVVAPTPPAAEPAATSWDGGYVGLNLGYGPGTATSDDFGSSSTTVDFSGFFLGAQAGYNFHLGDGIVLGVEADLNRANESGSTHFDDGNYDAIDSLDWTGALTGHLGFDGGVFMPYVLGGVAWAHNTVDYHDDDLDADNGSGSMTHTGYTVGVGIAAMLASNVSVFTEYRYANYGTQDYTGSGAPDTTNVSVVDSSIRAGLNLHF